MPFIGNKPTAIPLSADDLEDNIISTAKIQDNAVTPAKYIEPVPFRNIIINGDMSIAQRGTSATGLGNGDSAYHTCDRWQFNEGGSPSAEFTQTQSTDVPSGQGFATSLKMDCTTAQTSLAADEYMFLGYKVEGQHVQYLKKGTSSAESLTLSFWVKSNKTGTYICALRDADNSRWISKAYTVSSSSTWEKKTVTFAGDTTGTLNNDNGSSLNLYFYFLAGSDRTSGTLATSWESFTTANIAVGQVNLADSTSNEWYITGVQLEAGTAASDFEFLPTDVNLNRCLRYYNEINQGNNAGTFTVGGLDGNNGTAICSYTYPVVMRTSPTASYAGTFKLYVASTGTSKTDLNIQTGSRGFRTLTGSVTGTSGQAVQIDLEDTTVKVKLSAEL